MGLSLLSGEVALAEDQRALEINRRLRADYLELWQSLEERQTAPSWETLLDDAAVDNINRLRRWAENTPQEAPLSDALLEDIEPYQANALCDGQPCPPMPSDDLESELEIWNEEGAVNFYGRIHEACERGDCNAWQQDDPLLKRYRQDFNIEEPVTYAQMFQGVFQSIGTGWALLEIRQVADKATPQDYASIEADYQALLQKVQATYPPGHADILLVLDNLTAFYANVVEDYAKAESYYHNYPPLAVQIAQPNDARFITSLMNLAMIYQLRGKVGDMSRLLQRLYDLARETQGELGKNTLEIAARLGAAYLNQQRETEAIEFILGVLAVLKQQSRDERRQLIQQDDAVLGLFNSLGLAYQAQGDLAMAEKVLRKILPLSLKMHGATHRTTLGIQHNLGHVFYLRGDYAQAEKITRDILAQRRQLMTKDVVVSLNALCSILAWQHKSTSALSHCKEAQQLAFTHFSAAHPYHLTATLNYAYNLLQAGQLTEAAQVLREQESAFFSRAKLHFYTLESETSRRNLITGLSDYQDMVFALYAQAEQDPEIARFIANSILRWKSLQAEEEALLLQQTRAQGDNPEIARLLDEIKQQRRALSKAYSQGRVSKAALARLEADERTLARLSPAYESHLAVTQVDIAQIQQRLQADEILLEFRQYRGFADNPVDLAPARWMLLAVTAKEYQLLDIGEQAKSEALWQQLRAGQNCWQTAWRTQPPSAARLEDCDARTDAAAAPLYAHLFGALDQRLQRFCHVYIAPDGFLNLIPFTRLRLPDGPYWLQRQRVTQLHSGRYLLRPRLAPAPLARLVAVGDVDYGQAQMPSPQIGTSRGDLEAGFKPLSFSRAEVETIRQWFARSQILSQENATQANLHELLRQPADVLHLSTHGFYLGRAASPTPLLQAGIALSGADYASKPGAPNGILYGQEVLNLNLSATRLVVLSACDTAQGVLDYSEGVYGLERAFRIAGAQALISSLWQLNDSHATAFMVTFYHKWLSEPGVTPAQALRETQLGFLRDETPVDEKNSLSYQSSPHFWAAYVLFGK